jgi:hypothetical protein
VVIASALHVDRFKPEPLSIGWFALFGVGMIAFGSAALLSLRRTNRVRAAAAV